MEIPIDELLGWEEGEIIELTGPSERQVCISEPVKPGTQSKPVISKGHGHRRGYSK